MSTVDTIIERAIARGELDDLPGAGQPLDLKDESGIPEDQRLTWRILKNANMLPSELVEHQKLVALREQARAATDPAHRDRLLVELASRESVFKMRLERFNR